MVISSFRTLLVAAVGTAPLLTASLDADRTGCNSVAPGHSGGRSRTPRDTRGKLVDGEQPRHDVAILVARWDWTTATDHGRVGPSSMDGYLMKVAQRGLAVTSGEIPQLFPPSRMNLHLNRLQG